MTRFRFLIIDSKDRRSMVVCSVRKVVGDDNSLCVLVPNNDDINDDINDNATWIAIVHRNDLFNNISKNNLKQIKLGHLITPGIMTLLQKAELVIGYTGGAGGLIHHDFIKEAESAGFTNLNHWYCINQEGVDSKAYDTNGIEEIVKWTIDQHRSYQDLPRLLRIPESEGFQTSLSILCQGYLAHHALKSGNRLNGAIDTKEFNDVAAALKLMGWVNENGSNPEIVKELERERSACSADHGESRSDECNHDPSCNPESDLDFWQLPFEGGISLRQGLEREFRSLRKNVQDKIQKKMLEWPDSLKLPCQIEKLVKAIESATENDKAQEKSANNNKLFDGDFICVVARAYLELNILLEAA